ncbi:MAG: hypothetical protein RI973_2120 [Bacteroidota bacterium]|jgi:lipopolysaccharide export system protein LptA
MIPSRSKRWLRFLLLLAASTSSTVLHAQNQPVPGTPPPPGSKRISIRWADEFIFQITAPDTLQKLNGNVELAQDTVFLFCDSATLLNNTYMVARGNFILLQGDSLAIFSDSAEYNSITKIAELFSNVALVKGSQKLFTERLTYDVNTKIATWLTGATMSDDTTFLTSRRGYFNANTDDMYFGDSVVVVNPDFTLRSDTMAFNVSSSVVSFVAPTLISLDSARIYTEKGFYDINNKQAEFSQNPQYLKNDQKAWADLMRYDAKLKEITLEGNAHFEDSTTYATARMIKYNEQTEVTTLEGNAFIRDKDRTITGELVVYDARNENYSTRGRSHIVDGDQVLDAEEVDFDKERDIGIARGNIIWQDTTENLTVRCEYAEHAKKRNYLKASGGELGRPLLIKIIDGDSLFITADTLLSFQPETPADTLRDSTAVSAAETGGPGQEPATKPSNEEAAPASKKQPAEGVPPTGQPPSPGNLPAYVSPALLFNPRAAVLQPADSTAAAPPADSAVLDNRMTPSGDSIQISLDSIAIPEPADTASQEKTPRAILAYKDVRIFKSDLQAVCDSLMYSTQDSMFRLYRQPVIWSDTSQFTADTTFIQLANEKIDRIFLRQNSFIVNSPDFVFFNQIKGKNSTAFFEDGELRRVRVVGNAESVYYARDDEEAYIGVNKTVCSDMLMMFGDNQIDGIYFFAQPVANLFPMKKVDHTGLRMAGFSWQQDKRPRSLADLFTARAASPGR